MGTAKRKRRPPSLSGVSELNGRIYDVRDLDSIAILLNGEKTLRGLYRLSFDNGEAYTGQSINVVKRFANHRKRWDDIVAFEFFPIPTGDLNRPERMLIAHTEASATVRNIRDTRKPHGDTPLEVITEQGVSVALPWDRDARVRPDQAPMTRSAEKFAQLARTAEYPLLRDLVGWFLYEAIPDPTNTVRHLWTVSCLPSTRKSRNFRQLLTLNAGNLEVFVVYQEKVGDQWVNELFINTDMIDDVSPLQSPGELWRVENGSYRLSDVTQWAFPVVNLDLILGGGIEFPHLNLLLESAYKLNVRLMRQGATLFRRFHSDELATDLLAASLKWGNEEWWETIRVTPEHEA